MQITARIPLLIVTVMLLLAMANAMGQDKQFRYRAGVGFGFTFIPLAGNLGDTDARGLFVPSVRLDYFIHLLPRWEIGFMGNYELDHYMIVDQQIERDHALGLTLVGMFNITDHLGVFAGGGIEIETHQHLGVFRLGTEYSINMRRNWVLVPKLYFDFKQNYDTWSFAVTIAKKF
ncbi:MAG: hypothetical protein KAR16_08080 [Bacteroidales bacterium]|nr:hypothetical protein [Bacteroidales bacterium]